MFRGHGNLSSPLASEKDELLHSWIDELDRMMNELGDLLSDAIDLVEDIHDEVLK
jgi:hypothetical protein